MKTIFDINGTELKPMDVIIDYIEESVANSNEILTSNCRREAIDDIRNRINLYRQAIDELHKLLDKLRGCAIDCELTTKELASLLIETNDKYKKEK